MVSEALEGPHSHPDLSELAENWRKPGPRKPGLTDERCLQESGQRLKKKIKPNIEVRFYTRRFPIRNEKLWPLRALAFSTGTQAPEPPTP